MGGGQYGNDALQTSKSKTKDKKEKGKDQRQDAGEPLALPGSRKEASLPRAQNRTPPPMPFVFLQLCQSCLDSALSRPHQVPKAGRDKGFWEA